MQNQNMLTSGTEYILEPRFYQSMFSKEEPKSLKLAQLSIVKDNFRKVEFSEMVKVVE